MYYIQHYDYAWLLKRTTAQKDTGDRTIWVNHLMDRGL